MQLKIWMNSILAVFTVTASFALAQVPPQKTQPIKPHRKSPMHRPGAGNRRETFVRNHVTAPLGESEHSVPNEPGVVNNIKAAMAHNNGSSTATPNGAPAAGTANSPTNAGPSYIHNQ